MALVHFRSHHRRAFVHLLFLFSFFFLFRRLQETKRKRVHCLPRGRVIVLARLSSRFTGVSLHFFFFGSLFLSFFYQLGFLISLPTEEPKKKKRLTFPFQISDSIEFRGESKREKVFFFLFFCWSEIDSDETAIAPIAAQSVRSPFDFHRNDMERPRTSFRSQHSRGPKRKKERRGKG